MSRIGRKPITVPDGVKIKMTGSLVEVEGKKGKLTWNIPDSIDAKIEDQQIMIERQSDDKKVKALHGLTRALLSNMVTGVSEGFTKTLDIVGVGYRAEPLGKNGIKFNLGYSNPVEFTLTEGVSAQIEERGTRVILDGVDKQLVGEMAARIRKIRPPDPYKGKGVRYLGEILRLKPGKAGVKAL